MALIQKKDAGNLYVVEAQANEESIVPLVQGWIKRKHRGRLASGVIVDRETFRGCGAIQTQETIANSAGWKVGPLVAFSKAVSKVVPSKKGAAEFEPLPEHPLAVYLPTMGSTRATTAQDRLPTKLKSYLQLIVDPAIAHPEYLAHWFNTEAGLLFRSMSSSGTTIPAIKRLLHFFEAFAEFMAIIHLSAYTSDPGRWLLVQEKLKRASNGADLDFRRASFGLWCTVYNALAKETRRMLNEKDEDKQAIADLYSVASQSCLEGLVDKGLSQVLESANNMRNRKAHGGVISEAEAEEQHKELAALLQTVRDRLGSSFYSLQLVQAGSADGLPNGASRVSVRVLTGSNPQFKAEDIELVQHVVKGQLYLHEAGREKVLGVAPLVQMKEKEQPACYFYNRIEGGVPQLISYHFEHQAEAADETGTARAFLDRLAQ
ncbi:MAG: hypothetical protein IPH53_00365 [Flavobacteriales bacterium]|nr:hypothetical protein [Flavobacteriales bacterium]